MNTAVEEIKKRVDIVEYIGQFVTLKKAGRNFKGNCPFHQEKTPSFVVSPDRQIWHCFGSCGDGGDVIKFCMKWENLTFVEAVKEFAEKLGIRDISLQYQDKQWDAKERLLSMHRVACNYYQYILSHSPFGEKARGYLKERGIKEEIKKTFELGYAPSSWDSLLRYLKGKKYLESEIIASGLCVKSDRGKLYDRFRGRLMFPLKDMRGNIVGFSGRVLDPNEKQAKYLNSPETSIYHKRETLFGIHLVKEAVRRENAIILVEGEFDMITPFQYGVDNIVAIKGSAVTKEQLSLIKRMTNRVYLCLDADSAGEEAVKRAIAETEQMDFELGVILFEKGKDPDEAVRKDHVAFKTALKNPVPIYDFLIQFNIKKYSGDDAFSKKNIGDAIVPYISNIANPIVRSHYAKKLAHLLNVDEESIYVLMRSKQYERKGRSIPSSLSHGKPEKREDSVQKYLLSLLLQLDGIHALIDKLKGIVKPADFSFPAYQKIFESLIQYEQKNPSSGSVDINLFVESLPLELRAVVDELYLFVSSEKTDEKRSIERLAYEIRISILKKELKQLLNAKDDPESEKKLTDLNNELKELEKTFIKL